MCWPGTLRVGVIWSRDLTHVTCASDLNKTMEVLLGNIMEHHGPTGEASQGSAGRLDSGGGVAVLELEMG